MRAHQQEAGDNVRIRALRAAGELLAEGGTEKLNLRMIAARADIGLASIYYYFASKDELFLQLALDGFAALQEAMRNGAETSGDLFRGASSAYLEFAQDNSPLYRVMYDERMLAGFPVLHEAERGTLATFTAFVERDGRFPAEHAANIAWTLYAFGRGMSSLGASYPEGKLPEEQWRIFRAGLYYMLSGGRSEP